MAIETRGNNRYYYRKRRIGGRVVSEYIGSGSHADIAALEDERARDDTEARRQALTQAEHEYSELVSPVDQFESLLMQLMRAELLAAGYHQHKGQWRKKRCRSK